MDGHELIFGALRQRPGPLSRLPGFIQFKKISTNRFYIVFFILAKHTASQAMKA